ncbi:MAG: hypothetical protein NC340_09370 [Ruminococcus flavefaciens]|nr:hypothetical protein [Ruminococcus flavefaciens]MCM1230314.1 hypothetical protein [Ruminococcus flavefaciens]
MANNSLLWLKLDNAAKLYPAVKTKNWSNVFRLSVTLQEKINPDILQSALDVTVKRFPSIAMKLCKGFFWYYLESSEAPEVIPERPYPCSKMTPKDLRKCAFRVLYYENRIAVEFFHSLTDGNGGLIFLKTLTAEYLSQSNNIEIPYGKGVFDRTEQPVQAEMEDSFLKYDGSVSGSRREATAYQLSGTKETSDFKHIITGIVNLDDALRVARSYGVSLTAFLVSVMIYSIQQIQDREIRNKKKQKPVKVLVPVNLRKYFQSDTLRNFVLCISPGIDSNMGDFDFNEIVSIVHHQMKLQLTEKQMRAKITANVRTEKNGFLKFLPLFVKNIGIKTAFLMVGERKSSITMSNLGAVNIPDEMADYVKRFDFSLGVQYTGSNNCGILSYKDKLYINMIRNIEESELERLFFSNLVSHGIAVSVESNKKG